jgi:hypothetical protein
MGQLLCHSAPWPGQRHHQVFTAVLAGERPWRGEYLEESPPGWGALMQACMAQATPSPRPCRHPGARLAQVPEDRPDFATILDRLSEMDVCPMDEPQADRTSLVRVSTLPPRLAEAAVLPHGVPGMGEPRVSTLPEQRASPASPHSAPMRRGPPNRAQLDLIV